MKLMNLLPTPSRLEVLLKEYKVMMESPVNVASFVPGNLDDRYKNYAFTKSVKENLVNPSDNFEKLNVYSYEVGKRTYDLFVEGEFSVAFFSYEIDEMRMTERSVWQDGLNIGLCRDIIFDYYLKKYDEIVSDGLHTELGKNYWKKIIKEASTKGYLVQAIVAGNYHPIDLENLDQYWSNNPHYTSILFSIKKS